MKHNQTKNYQKQADHPEHLNGLAALVRLLARQAASEILLLQTKEDDNGTEANED
ncbi:MAG: hypothetical protein HN884_02770 [Rhodospirillaceae bacterium]|jgi:hypothetical protein|nr:hypothetical protein [Rhodospirillaceae bacterium]MBT7265772.1 hypothetical protein [Rhodospirillaceae bacterium]